MCDVPKITSVLENVNSKIIFYSSTTVVHKQNFEKKRDKIAEHSIAVYFVSI